MVGLRIFTTASLVLGIAVLIYGAVNLSQPPDTENRRLIAEYGLRGLITITASMILFVSTAVGAVLMLRATREAALRDQEANLATLVEGTLRDHEPTDPS